MKHLARLSWMLAALAGLVLPASPTPAGEPDPAEIAQNCIQRAAAIAEHCAHRNAEFAAACVEHITELLEQGHPEAAMHLGMRCIHRTNLRSARCLHRIQAGCSHCIELLIGLGAPQLARSVGQACQEAATLVNESRLAAIQAIHDALPGDGGGGGASVPPCPADVDLDETVGLADLLALLAAWGTDPIEPPDIDGDGAVGGSDLLELIAAWGPCD